MGVAAWIIGGLEVCCMLVSPALIYGLTLQPRQATTRLFLGIILLNVGGLLSDTAYWVFDGMPGMGIHILLRISDFLNHALAMVIIAGLAEFFWTYAKARGVAQQKDRWLFNMIWALCLLGVLFTAIAQGHNLFSYFDAYNRYHSTDLYPLAVVMPFLLLTLLALCTHRYRKRLLQRERLSFFVVYDAIPAAAVILQLIDPHLTIAYICIYIILLIFYANLYSEQARHLRASALQITQNMAASMVSQIRPAFLYDSLAMLQRLCLSDPANAKDVVLAFTRHLRARLDAVSLRALVPFEEELAYTQHYLALEAKRLGHAIHARYEIGAADFALPALTVQSVVEDWIWDAGTTDAQRAVHISAYETERLYLVEILCNDAGKGAARDAPKPADPSRFAIIRDAVASLCGGDMAGYSPAAGVYAVTIKLPKQPGQRGKKGAEPL